MKLFLLSYIFYDDRFRIKNYKLVYAESFEQAEAKLDACVYEDYSDVKNETIL